MNDKNLETSRKGFGKFDIKLGQQIRNALKIMCAKYDMTPSQIITMALDEYYRKKLSGRERQDISDDGYCNQVIGELINSNRGVFGYDAVMNPIPEDKFHMQIESDYEDTLE